MSNFISNYFFNIKEKIQPSLQKAASLIKPNPTAVLAFAALALHILSLSPESPVHSPELSTRLIWPLACSGAVALSGAWTLVHALRGNYKKASATLACLAVSSLLLGTAQIQQGYKSGLFNAPLPEARIIYLGDNHAMLHLADLRAEIFNQLHTNQSLVLVETDDREDDNEDPLSADVCNLFVFNGKASEHHPLRCFGWDNKRAYEDQVELLREYATRIIKNSDREEPEELEKFREYFLRQKKELMQQRDLSLVQSLQRNLKRNFDRIFVVAGARHFTNKVLSKFFQEAYHLLIPASSISAEADAIYVQNL